MHILFTGCNAFIRRPQAFLNEGDAAMLSETNGQRTVVVVFAEGAERPCSI